MVIIGVIKDIDRLANSASGNPRYFVTMDSGAGYKTAPDAQVGFGVTNDEYNHGATVRITLDARSEIVGIRTADGKHFTGRTEDR